MQRKRKGYSMQQVIFIHGGTTFFKYEDFKTSLETKPVLVERLTSGRNLWMQHLDLDLGSDYQVLFPSMPNKQNARYEEWSLWFSRIAEVAEDDCILIGHSMGGIFLAKYLNEHHFPKRIAACISIAAPYNDETLEDLTDFKIESEGTGALNMFAEQVNRAVFFHGTDDPVVDINDARKYRTALPQATFHELPAPDHFMRGEFPELLTTIKELSR